MKNEKDLTNKIYGALYGFAIGDSMGATTEFLTKQSIKRRYGKVNDLIGGGWLNLKVGDVTDDTQMMICIIDAIMDDTDGWFMLDVANNFIKWMDSNPIDIGAKCNASIKLLKLGKGIPIDQSSLGNGSLMRALPFALLKNKNLNIMQGGLTHNSTICSEIIGLYTDIVESLLMEVNTPDELISNLRPMVHSLMDPSGHVQNTFNNVLYWARKQSFEDAIVGAVNDGGDADTIAAITGSLAGLIHGFNAIPEKWVEKLDKNVQNKLDNFANYCLQMY